ncbi:MAG: radical SAM protein, partial [bacterium]|nr:radical SAM protein [bacterium]
GVWVEVTTLVIPTISDSVKTLKDIAKFIKKELGAETPWHLSKFSGLISWQLHHLPDTSLETLRAAYEIGKEAGLKYVYTGNIPGLPSEDTFCPKCNALVVDRTGFMVFRHDQEGKCPKCGQDINLILE